MADEARTLEPVLNASEDAPAHTLDVAGIGPANASAASERLLAAGVTGLMSWGTAGALDPTLTSGSLLVYTDALDSAGQRYVCDPQWSDAVTLRLTAFNAKTGSGYTTGDAVTSADAKSALLARTQCIAVDMESAAIAAVAAAAGIRFLAVRVIVDPAHIPIPGSALAGLAEDGTTRPLRVLGALARRPWELPRLLGLARRHAAALSTLKRAATVLAPDFGA